MPLAAALFGAVAISFSAIFFAQAGVEPVTGAFFRATYALPVLFVLWTRVRAKDTRSSKARWLALASGVMLGLDFTAWHLAIGYIGTGLATLLANCQVVIVAMLAWLIFHERPSRQVMVAIPVVLVGVALVSGLGRADSFGSNPLLGSLFGAMAAMFYAGFLLAYRRSNRARTPAVGSLMDATAGAALTALALGPLMGGLDLIPSWPAHGWLMVLAIVSQVGGWLSIGYALPRLPAAETSTFILVQPVMTMVWGALIFAERPSALQLTGAVVVLAGVGLVALVNSRRRPARVAATT